MAITEAKTSRVPSFADISAVKAAQEAKRLQIGGVDLYPRDGSRELSALEKDIAGMMGVRVGNLLLYSTGMSAVIDALEITRPTSGTRVLRGNQFYSQAGNYISDELVSRGVEMSQVDSRFVQDIYMTLDKVKPDIVFLETVTNGSEMATIDVRELLDLSVMRKLNPLIVLDNTLPTTTGIPLGSIMASSDRRIIGIESGTKFIGVNTEMCGIAYTNDKDLLSALRKRRQRTGSLLSLSAVRTIRDCMPQTPEAYWHRNKSIFGHTLRLALACSSAQAESGEFVVNHPNLPTHPNNEYANSCSSDGISPVFFIVPSDFGSRGGHYQIAERLWENPVISSLCELGQSFGFDKSRIWPDDNSPVVRISGGIYSEEDQRRLDEAFYEVLSGIG